jgi:hypothetical protein
MIQPTNDSNSCMENGVVQPRERDHSKLPLPTSMVRGELR